METPTEVLLGNLDSVLDAFNNSKSTKNAYKLLTGIPEIAAMPFNTFNTIAPAIVKTANYVMNKTEGQTMNTITTPEQTSTLAKQAIELAEQALALARQSLAQLDQVSTLESSAVQTETDQTNNEYPKKYKNWNVARCGDGYIRMNSEINGRRTSVFVGKVWDTEAVEKKLNPKQIGLLDGQEPVEKIKIPEDATTDPPKKWNGWIVAKGNDGYIRMNKRVNNKHVSVYIGKVWSPEIAEAKLKRCTFNLS